MNALVVQFDFIYIALLTMDVVTEQLYVNLIMDLDLDP